MYTFLTPIRFLPRLVELENNPGQLGEQSISVRYMCGSERPCDINAETLAARVIPTPSANTGKARSSLENLPGKPYAESCSSDHHRGALSA